MAASIREAFEQAWTDLEGGAEPPDASPKPIEDKLPVVESKTEEPVVEVKAEEPVVKAEPVKVAPKPAPTKLTPKPPVQAAPAPQVGRFKPPQSWRPAVRDHWGKLPAEVQEEVTKRETEVSRALVQSAAARKFADEFGSVVRPFEHLIRTSGVDPLKAVQNLMTTAASLQTGTPAQKAQVISNIIKAYGVDIAVLDQVLSGQTPKPGTPGAGPDPSILAALDARLKPVTEFMSRLQGQTQQQQQQLEQEAAQTYEQFANDPANEFVGDLAEDMADLLEMSAKRGRVMTMKQAYDLAANQHPEISKVVAERKAADTATRAAGGIEKARRAAASQSSGSPGTMGGSSAKPKGVRAAVSQAWDDLSAGT